MFRDSTTIVVDINRLVALSSDITGNSPTIVEMKRSDVDFEKLREAAEIERLSDRAIAEKTGLSPFGVGKILRGQTEPGASNLKRICDTIGLPIDEAFIEKAAA